MADTNNTPANQSPTNFMKRPGGSIFENKKLLIFGAIFIAVLVFLVGFLSSGLGGSKVNKYTNQGKTAMLAGDYNKAKENFKQALQSNKSDPTALAGLIDASSIQGNATGKEKDALTESQPYIDQALNSNPNDPKVLVSAGYAYEAAGDYQKALDYYQQAVKQDPNSSDAWFHLGHDLQFLGRGPEAYKDYEKAYSLDPNNPQSLMAKGGMALTQKDLSGSYDFYKKASEAQNINPDLKAEALTAASLVRSLQSDKNHILDATVIAKQAVDTSPNYSPALAAYGYFVYLTAEDKTQGLIYIQKAIDANPRISKNYVLLAQLYFSHKVYDKAINYYKDAVTRVDDDNTILSDPAKKIAKGEYLYELSRAYDKSGLSVDVSSLLLQALDLNPTVKPRLKADISAGEFKSALNNQDLAKAINT